MKILIYREYGINFEWKRQYLWIFAEEHLAFWKSDWISFQILLLLVCDKNLATLKVTVKFLVFIVCGNIKSQAFNVCKDIQEAPDKLKRSRLHSVQPNKTMYIKCILHHYTALYNFMNFVKFVRDLLKNQEECNTKEETFKFNFFSVKHR